MSTETHKRAMFAYALRYRAGSRLARQSPGFGRGRFRTAEIAEQVRSHCSHADQIEVVDIREVGCSVDGCDRAVFARGWCAAHYARVQRTGEVGPAELQTRSPR